MTQEGRVHPRTKTYLEVTYFTDESTVELGRNYFFGTVLDVSKGGAGLLTEWPHEPNEKLWLEGLHNCTGAVRVEVRWVKHYYDKYNLGVKFAHQEGAAQKNQGRIPGKWSIE